MGLISPIRRFAAAYLVLTSSLFPAAFSSGETAPDGLRLQEVLSRATGAFQQGKYQEAVEIFDILENEFGREPELEDPAVQRILLPSRGYAEFALQNYPEAIERFERFLEQFPETGTLHAFVLYTLAQAYQLEGIDEKAVERLNEFSIAYPREPETGLSVIQRAEVLLRMGKTDEALEVIDALYVSNASETLQIQARLRALQVLIEKNRIDDAFSVIESTNWNIERMPELAVLAFAALQLGDRLSNEKRYADAIVCYRLVPPYQVLEERQEQQLAQVQRVLDYRRRNVSTPMASAWNDYYAQLALRLENQLEALQQMNDYMPGYLLRYGQAFLQSGRAREALLVFRDLALDESIPEEIRQQGHYRWILSNYSLEKWEDTLATASTYEELYPNSELAPDAVYLVAQAYQEQQKFRSAISVFTRLLEDYPEHTLAPRWLFTRGFNQAMLEQYEESRKDFSEFEQRYGDHRLAIQARMWHGLTHHFEGNYETAIEELTALKDLSEDHYLYPEIQYRIGTAYYGLRDYATARALIESYLADYPQHLRAPEATVLRGDILMGLGELIEASAAFAKVTPEAEGLFPYAVFQRGKIFKALERYDLMIDHFSEYLERDDLELHPRMSEALYWLGWAQLQSGNPGEALIPFDRAINEFGNDPSATEILPLLASLEAIRLEYLKSGDDSSVEHSVLLASSFDDWLNDQIDLALEEKNLTWFSRLKHFQANRAKSRGEQTVADTIFQEIDERVPMEQLDPLVIGEIGIIYSDKGYNYAIDYYDYILEEHPGHPARAEAWFGKAQILAKQDQLEEAEDLLRKFDSQMPLHHLGVRVKILRGDILTSLGLYDDAEKIFEDVLKLKHARGVPHAEALSGLAKLNEDRGDLERAVPYWQRIYTLYRGYPEFVAEAYFRSAEIFQQLGRPEAAYRSLEEMLADERLLRSPFALRATDLRKNLLEEYGPFSEAPGSEETLRQIEGGST
ncbi:MAG: tetratricopeptide repeat protein [Verrucomicrobiota bacterium]